MHSLVGPDDLRHYTRWLELQASCLCEARNNTFNAGEKKKPMFTQTGRLRLWLKLQDGPAPPARGIPY